MGSHGSISTTHHIEVRVHPEFLPTESNPAMDRFVFGYHITIANNGRRTVQLLERHWIILDADGERRDVRGEGVVGLQPILSPGESFEYRSGCPLATPWGTMEGTYTFRYVRPRKPGAPTSPPQSEEAMDEPLEHSTTMARGSFEVAVGRFFLVATNVPLRT